MSKTDERGGNADDDEQHRRDENGKLRSMASRP
jgi:hypothetical protein